MSDLKRYLVFAYLQYYPSGGMGDFRLSLDKIPTNKYLENMITSDERLSNDEGYIEVYDSWESKFVACLKFDLNEFEDHFNTED